MTQLKKLRAGLAALRKMWRERDKLADRSLSADLKSFLPPALEVAEKPPHPLPKTLYRLIGAFFLTALIWSIFGRLDIISVAEGKIIPSGKVKEIQPFDRGVVKAILVTEGQLAEAGQPLIELDQVQTKAEETRLEVDRNLAEDKRKIQKILVNLLQLRERPSNESVLNHPDLDGDTESGRKLLETYKSVASQLAGLEAQIREREAELAACLILISQYMKLIPLTEQRLNSLETLFNKKMVGINEFYSVKEHYIELTDGLETERKRSEQLQAAVSSAAMQLEAFKSESLAKALTDLDEYASQVEALEQELVKIKDLGSKQVLYSPVRGTVKGLQTNTVGGVVSSAQVLMEIVPLEEILEVEAFLGNQDIGYVRVGQSAEVKVATFPFTKYGVINAEVTMVAEDATADENLGLIYRIRLRLEKNSIMVDGKETPLLPGMAVSAEIVTEKQRAIEYILTPLLRIKNESLRER